MEKKLMNRPEMHYLKELWKLSVDSWPVFLLEVTF